MRLSFTPHAHVTLAISQALLGAPLIPELTCRRKASPEKQIKYIETTCDEGGKKTRKNIAS